VGENPSAKGRLPAHLNHLTVFVRNMSYEIMNQGTLKIDIEK
jgi:hypothetical protein